MDLGQKLRQRREQLGLSQADVAQLMRIAQGRISEWESGARTQMSLQNLRSMARALGVTADYLIGTWEEGETPVPAPSGLPAVVPPGTSPTGPRRRGRPRKATALARAGT
jgi:transcriptional regulator with XRE-family HTH domain